ncbi:MAG: hypothetical protein ABI193_12385 [Minicystis sp.]
MNRSSGIRWLSSVVLGAMGIAAGACSSSVGTSSTSSTSGTVSTSSTTGGGGNAGTGGSATTVGSSMGGNAGTGGNSGTGGSGGEMIYPCSPTDAVCTKVSSPCLALADYSMAGTTSLRMGQFTMSKPQALSGNGVVSKVLQNAALMNLPACFLEGGGTFSWLLQLDLAAGKLKTGGAKPANDPTMGYSFVSQGAIGPLTLDAPVAANGSFTSAVGVKLVMPIYLDAAGNQAVILPLRQIVIAGQLTSKHNCIGKFNADTLQQDNNCLADQSHPTFTSGGTVDAFISLEDADSLALTTPPETLCVLLSGDADTYGDGGNPVNKCKRTGGKINFKGDWCTATNMAATANCFDAVKLHADFAASAVKILN